VNKGEKCMIGILGGGLTGLVCADLLNDESTILEKESECGGLCRSLQKKGFTFDYGGSHIIFSKDDVALEYMISLLGNNKNKVRRNTKILYKGNYVKYPFENGLADLSLQDNYECLYYYIEILLRKARGELEKPINLEEWMFFTFGKGITEKYMQPYNKKIWNFDPKLMSLDWVNGRVPEPPIEDVIKSSLGMHTEGYTHQLYFYYPKVGGIQSIIKALEKRNKAEIIRNIKVKSIKRNSSNTWLISNGYEVHEFDRLISTIPLQELLEILNNIPENVANAINDLKYNSLITVMIGIDVPKLNDISWLYIPSQDDGIFNRVSFPSNYSDKVTPDGKSSILAEITCFKNDPIWKMTDSEILELIIKQLDILAIIDKNTVCFSEVRRLNYAYVIYDLNYNANMQIIVKYFKELGIELVGRFSEFRYLNMDACVKSAMKMVEKLNRGE
jgi:protoporphyrinogen oxidase